MYVLDGDNGPVALQLECLTPGIPRIQRALYFQLQHLLPNGRHPAASACVAATISDSWCFVSQKVWMFDLSFGSLLLGCLEHHSWGKGTKPQNGRNSAILYSLPSCQTTALAVVDTGSNPCTSACQRLAKCCQSMRMSIKIYDLGSQVR